MLDLKPHAPKPLLSYSLTVQHQIHRVWNSSVQAIDMELPSEYRPRKKCAALNSTHDSR